MPNPLTGFQLAEKGVSLSPSSAAAPTPATPQPRSNSTGKTVAPRIYRYPLENMLESYSDYLKISSYQYIPPGVGDIASGNFSIGTSDEKYSSLGKKDIRGTVLLPIPQGVPVNSQSAKWGEGNLSPITAGLIGVGKEVIESGNPLAGLTKGVASFIGKVTSSAQTGLGQKSIQTFFTIQAVQQLLGQDQNLFGDILARETGAVINENIELLFRGVNLRETFSLSFDLAPRDNKEAQEIRNMILFLKKEMSPRKGTKSGAAGGLFLTAPSVFKIEYMSGKKNHPYLNRFKICAMSGLSVNFTPDNTYATYSDGTPVHMQLSLSFQELTPIYAEDYTTTEGTSGVGY